MAAFWQLVGYVPCVAVLGALFCWLSVRHRWKGTRPFADKLLREAGHSLQAKVDALNEKLLLPIAGLVLASALVGWITDRLRPYPGDLTQQILLVTWSCGLVVATLAGWRLVHVVRAIGDYNLGLLGERAVGEELNKLMAHGCFVYHDYPGGANWNIDHIVVAPSGVYAIETKTRRKKKHLSPDFYKVAYDGQRLTFPTGTDQSALTQVQRNASSLCDTLSKAEAEPVPVHPILILPGWMVERKAIRPVMVMSHKEITRSIITNGSAVLSKQQMKRIAERIEDKCRDVEF